MRTVLLALALLAFPLTAQEPEPPVNDDVATFRAVLAEQLSPMQAIMVEQLKVMQEQRDEIKKLREQIGKQQACKEKQ
jgi:Spy/CpxP family protein refolding chaperone